MSQCEITDQARTSDCGSERRNCNLSLVGQSINGTDFSIAKTQNTADCHLPSLDLFAIGADEQTRKGHEHSNEERQEHGKDEQRERRHSRHGEDRRSVQQAVDGGFATGSGDNSTAPAVSGDSSIVPDRSAGDTASGATKIPDGSAAVATTNTDTPSSTTTDTSTTGMTTDTPSSTTTTDTPVVAAPDVLVTSGGNFTVSESGGFVSPDGKPFNMRGLNATVADAEIGFQNALKQYPDMTAIRLNVVPGQDSMERIDKVIQEYTSKGIVVEAENHSADVGNIGWYSDMAAKYKDNPLVMLETPNEPSGDANSVANNQIDVIRAIRASGYTNPIGVQPIGGYDESNFSQVTAALGNEQLYATPHLYYYGEDPNGAADYMGALKQGASSQGLYSWFDEFGNDKGDGVTPAPQGASVLKAVIDANKSNQVGATFWAMDNVNHPDGTDSAYLSPDGSQLTPIGQQLQQWI